MGLEFYFFKKSEFYHSVFSHLLSLYGAYYHKVSSQVPFKVFRFKLFSTLKVY